PRLRVWSSPSAAPPLCPYRPAHTCRARVQDASTTARRCFGARSGGSRLRLPRELALRKAAEPNGGRDSVTRECHVLGELRRHREPHDAGSTQRGADRLDQLLAFLVPALDEGQRL